MFQQLLFILAVNIASVYGVAQFLDGFVVQGGTWGYVAVGVVLALLNSLLKPILKIVSLPLIFLTAGLFTLVINAGMLWLAQELINGFELGAIHFAITGVTTYIASAVLLGIANYLFLKMFD